MHYGLFEQMKWVSELYNFCKTVAKRDFLFLRCCCCCSPPLPQFDFLNCHDNMHTLGIFLELQNKNNYLKIHLELRSLECDNIAVHG